MKSSRKNKSINRRELIGLAGTLGGLAALSSFLAACERAGLISPGASEVPVGQLNGTPAETPFPIQPSQPAVINPATEMPIQSSATSEVANLGIAADQREAVKALLEKAVQKKVDLILSSAGCERGRVRLREGNS